MEAMPQMSGAEFKELRAKMRDAYAVPLEDVGGEADKVEGEPHDSGSCVTKPDQSSEFKKEAMVKKKPYRTYSKQLPQQSGTRANLDNSTIESTQSALVKSIDKSDDDASTDW
jgi:hypothetical protein